MTRFQIIASRLPALRKLQNPCGLCMHKCMVNRRESKLGTCRSGTKAAVYSWGPHHGEEPPLSGARGSGTIFFTRCNMRCAYCQNYQFSQESGYGEVETAELAGRMLNLADEGCHNINLVSPTHYACQIAEALEIAYKKSLDIPVVYNTGGYDSLELIKLLDGIVDIYLPDMRYFKNEEAKKFSSAPDYADNNRAIIKEMYAQVGNLKTDKNGIARKGVIVRLLILPNNVSGTIDTLKFLREEVSNKIFLSVMSQYHPTYRATDYPEISRRITASEYDAVVQAVEELGFANGWIQGYLSEPDHFLGTNIKPR